MVVNGMSASGRNSRWANAGIVVEIRPSDIPEYASSGALGMMKFQEWMEEQAWIAGGKNITAPAQRMNDFINKKMSSNLPDSSYFSGLISSPLHDFIPEFITSRIRSGLHTFDRISKGFITAEAQLIGVETRTSSPVRILRNSETFQHIEIKGLYPCGEGAGYAGGIVSAAIDGEKCAESIAKL
jgi:uncharacterized FAD-dependent dehydrogenase